MSRDELLDLLGRVRRGEVVPEDAADRLAAPEPDRAPPAAFQDLGFARIDVGREARCGFPEVVFAPGKTPEEAAEIAAGLVARAGRVLLTRCGDDVRAAVQAALPDAVWHARARALTCSRRDPEAPRGLVALLSAGTSDLPVAEEARVTAELMGARVEARYDVGVAGLHRLLAEQELLRNARVLVVCAGMEGALASVVGGLVSRPVIAVPTSVGYGANFQGLAALLGMLNSCSPNVAVVNIDNGFGAGYLAATINRDAAAAPGT